MNTIQKKAEFSAGEIVSAFVGQYAEKNGMDNWTAEVARAVGELRRYEDSHRAMYEACKLGLAAMIAWGGKCEANGEHILARESVIQAEIIRQAIAKATQ